MHRAKLLFSSCGDVSDWLLITDAMVLNWKNSEIEFSHSWIQGKCFKELNFCLPDQYLLVLVIAGLHDAADDAEG